MLQLVNSKIQTSINRLLDLLGKQWVGIVLLGAIFGLLSLQGYDYGDEGYVMYAYQNFFKAPETCEYYYLCYLTGFIGGLWELLFGGAGYISYRILNVLVILATFCLLYRILKPYTKSAYWIFLGYFLALIDYSCSVCFHYNFVSGLFGVAIVGALCRAYGQGNGLSIRWLILASALTGIAIFARFPNICLVGVIGVAILLASWKQRSFKSFLCDALTAFIGLMVGVGVMVGLMKLLGHWNIYQEVLTNLLSGKSVGSSHTSTNLLAFYIEEYTKLVWVFIMTLIAGIMSILALKAHTPKWYLPIALLVIELAVIHFTTIGLVRLVALLLTVIAILRCLAALIHSPKMLFQYWGIALVPMEWLLFRMRYGAIYVIYGIAFFLAVIAIYRYRHEFKKVYLIGISACLAVLLPLGSDRGLVTVGLTAIPLLLTLGLIFASDNLSTLSNDKLRRFFKYTGILSIVIYIGYNFFYKTSQYCWFDEGSRFEKHYRITQSDLATTFTSKDKAEAIDTLLVHLKPYIHEGDYTFFFHSLPTIHYLTRTKPYLHNPWVFYISDHILEKKIKKAEERIPYLPVLVRQKSADFRDWLTPVEDWNRTDISVSTMHKSQSIALIQDFIKRHNYHIVWENELFVIYLPEKQ
jgi:hypothetical protein